MRFVGVDLHKHTITVVVVDAARKLLVRKRFSNLMSIQIIAFLKTLGGVAQTRLWASGSQGDKRKIING